MLSPAAASMRRTALDGKNRPLPRATQIIKRLRSREGNTHQASLVINDQQTELDLEENKRVLQVFLGSSCLQHLLLFLIGLQALLQKRRVMMLDFNAEDAPE